MWERIHLVFVSQKQDVWFSQSVVRSPWQQTGAIFPMVTLGLSRRQCSLHMLYLDATVTRDFPQWLASIPQALAQLEQKETESERQGPEAQPLQPLPAMPVSLAASIAR